MLRILYISIFTLQIIAYSSDLYNDGLSGTFVPFQIERTELKNQGETIKFEQWDYILRLTLDKNFQSGAYVSFGPILNHKLIYSDNVKQVSIDPTTRIEVEQMLSSGVELQSLGLVEVGLVNPLSSNLFVSINFIPTISRVLTYGDSYSRSNPYESDFQLSMKSGVGAELLFYDTEKDAFSLYFDFYLHHDFNEYKLKMRKGVYEGVEYLKFNPGNQLFFNIGFTYHYGGKILEIAD